MKEEKHAADRNIGANSRGRRRNQGHTADHNVGDHSGRKKKKESGIRSRPQRRGEFRSESATSSGPAGQVLPPACMLLGMDCTETLLRDRSQHRGRSHSERGSSGSSAGQELPLACILSSTEAPGTLTRCRLNRQGTLCVYIVSGRESLCFGGCRVGIHALGKVLPTSTVQVLYPRRTA